MHSAYPKCSNGDQPDHTFFSSENETVYVVFFQSDVVIKGIIWTILLSGCKNGILANKPRNAMCVIFMGTHFYSSI